MVTSIPMVRFWEVFSWDQNRIVYTPTTSASTSEGMVMVMFRVMVLSGDRNTSSTSEPPKVISISHPGSLSAENSMVVFSWTSL